MQLYGAIWCRTKSDIKLGYFYVLSTYCDISEEMGVGEIQHGLSVSGRCVCYLRKI